MLLGVEAELSALDDANEALAEVMALGFTDKEARLALRAESGNVAKAVKYAEKERKSNEKAEIRKKYAEKARAERQRIAGEEAARVQSFSPRNASPNAGRSTLQRFLGCCQRFLPCLKDSHQIPNAGSVWRASWV